MEIRVHVGRELSDLFERGTDKPRLVRMLRRSVTDNSGPTLAAVLARTPFLKGQLQASIGLTHKLNAKRGEVYTIVGVKDNALAMVGGRKVLYSSGRLKSSARRAARAGASSISSATAFKYVRGIETGYKSNGKMARKAGAARMFQFGARDTADGFTSGVSDDALAFVLDGQGG